MRATGPDQPNWAMGTGQPSPLSPDLAVEALHISRRLLALQSDHGGAASGVDLQGGWGGWALKGMHASYQWQQFPGRWRKHSTAQRRPFRQSPWPRTPGPALATIRAQPFTLLACSER